MRRAITKGRLTAAAAVIVLGVLGVLPFLVPGGRYGDVPIPGAADVHLPTGEVDVTLRTVGPAEERVPPLCVHISGLDRTAGPEVIESPRTKYTSDKGDMLVRVWVVHVAQEGDYRVEVQGETYGPYQPSLTFERNMWNEPLEALLTFCAVLSWMLLIAMPALFGLVGLILTLWTRCTRRAKQHTGAMNLWIVQGNSVLEPSSLPCRGDCRHHGE